MSAPSGGSLVAGFGSRTLQGLVTNCWQNWVLKSGLLGPGIPGQVSDHWCYGEDCLLTQLVMRLWRSWCWLAVPGGLWPVVGGLCEHGFLVSGVCPLMFEADLEASTGFCRAGLGLPTGGWSWVLAAASGGQGHV